MQVAVEITGMLNLTNWPAGMRVIIRREHPHPSASLTLFEDADGWRYQAVATNTPLAKGGQVAFLEARHRAHAAVETRIRHVKDSGIGRFPPQGIRHQPGMLEHVGIVKSFGPTVVRRIPVNVATPTGKRRLRWSKRRSRGGGRGGGVQAVERRTSRNGSSG